MPQRNFVKVQMHTEHGPLFLLCSFHPFIFFLSFGKFVSAAHRGTPPWTPGFLFPFFVLFSFPSYLFCILSILVRCPSLNFQFCGFFEGEPFDVHRWQYICRIKRIDRAPCKIVRWKLIWCCFFFVETIQPKFKHVLAEARPVRFSVRSRTTFCLPPVFRCTIASLRSATTTNKKNTLLN